MVYLLINQYFIEKMANWQWGVQKNPTNHNDFSSLMDACQKFQVPFLGIDIIPFSHELPYFDRATESYIYLQNPVSITSFPPDEELAACATENPLYVESTLLIPTVLASLRFVEPIAIPQCHSYQLHPIVTAHGRN